MSFLRSLVAVAIFGWTGISIARFCGAVIEYLYERSECMSGAVKEEGYARFVHCATDTSHISAAWDAWWQGTIALCLLWLVLRISNPDKKEE